MSGRGFERDVSDVSSSYTEGACIGLMGREHPCDWANESRVGPVDGRTRRKSSCVVASTVVDPVIVVGRGSDADIMVEGVVRSEHICLAGSMSY